MIALKDSKDVKNNLKKMINNTLRKMSKVRKTCEVCGKEYEAYDPYNRRRYCSIQCNRETHCNFKTFSKAIFANKNLCQKKK